MKHELKQTRDQEDHAGHQNLTIKVTLFTVCANNETHPNYIQYPLITFKIAINFVHLLNLTYIFIKKNNS